MSGTSILKASPVTASQITNLMTRQRGASGLLTSLKHLNVRCNPELSLEKKHF
jgi:hypothetical protein